MLILDDLLEDPPEEEDDVLEDPLEDVLLEDPLEELPDNPLDVLLEELPVEESEASVEEESVELSLLEPVERTTTDGATLEDEDFPPGCWPYPASAFLSLAMSS